MENLMKPSGLIRKEGGIKYIFESPVGCFLNSVTPSRISENPI